MSGKRDKFKNTRLNEEEYADLVAQTVAAGYGKNTSEYIRDAIYNYHRC